MSMQGADTPKAPLSKMPQVGTTIFTEMSALASACGALNVAQGFPDLETPPALRQAVTAAIESDGAAASHGLFGEEAVVLHERRVRLVVGGAVVGLHGLAVERGFGAARGRLRHFPQPFASRSPRGGPGPNFEDTFSGH